MSIIASYINGNTEVVIKSDGTKIRQYEGIATPDFPESIDVKITDYCDLGCPYCHESSTTAGGHGNLNRLLEIIADLPAGIELAIGGGNPLSHPDIIPFLKQLAAGGYIANITVNQGHLKPYFPVLSCLVTEGLVKGVGISITSSNYKFIEAIHAISDNIVFHVIAGVNTVEIMDVLTAFGDSKVLVLGYKDFGFGWKYRNREVDDNIIRWKKHLRKYIFRCTLSFDNLAIEQLNIRSWFTTQGWEKFYMGDDFCFTMYIDAVKQEYAPTSRSADRVSFEKCSLLKYFQENRNKIG